jgi:DNA-binding XRE family transcriptional regulator
MKDMERQRAREKHWQAVRRARTRAREAHWREHGRECIRCGQTRECPEQIGIHPNAKVCEQCKAARTRERRRAWAAKQRATDPGFRLKQTDATRRWRARHRDRHLEYSRLYYEWLKAEPERWARHLEDARINYRLRQERQGRTVQPLSEETYIARYGSGYGRSTRLPAEPLKPLVRDGVQMWGEETLAGLARVSVKRVREVANGKMTVSLVTADRLCNAFGLPLSAIYQDENYEDER